MDRHLRRRIRTAVHDKNIAKLKALIRETKDTNYILSERQHDTILSYCVRHGNLECVEYLVSQMDCSLDTLDRNHRSTLDTAVHEWLKLAFCKAAQQKSTFARRYISHSAASACLNSGHSGTAKKKPNAFPQFEQTSRTVFRYQVSFFRYRILKCLLKAGARRISPVHIDLLLFSTMTCQTGSEVVFKLARAASNYGVMPLKHDIFSNLCSYSAVHSSLTVLLYAGVNPAVCLQLITYKHQMALDTALLLLVSSNDSDLLTKIECDTSYNMKEVTSTQNWTLYRSLLFLLTVTGHKIRLHILDFLYCNHAQMYLSVNHYNTNPRPLKHLCRQLIRTKLLPNTLLGVKALKQVLPDQMQKYLLFDSNFAKPFYTRPHNRYHSLHTATTLR